jgi:release factor glutamine methyltransferase
VIVSNPPYIGEHERDDLDVEVRDWEPSTALFSGSDGLDMIRDLVEGAEEHLRPRGLLALEIGAAQGAAVCRMIRETGHFAEPALIRDLSGRERMVTAELVGSPAE